MIICIGDSLTLGAAGYSYIPFAGEQYRFVNKGVNGDSLYGIHRRLNRYLKEEKYAQAQLIIIGAGTNDVLIPYLRSRSKSWERAYCRRNRKLHFAADVMEFSERYERMVREVLDKGIRLMLIGLPYIELSEYPVAQAELYNDCICDIAKRYQIPFIDIFSFGIKHTGAVYDWGIFSSQRMLDGLYMGLYPKRKDVLSKKRKLMLTVDGVHFNSRTARVLGRKVKEMLDKEL